MRKAGLLSAALLLASSGIALTLHAQAPQSTTPPAPIPSQTQTATPPAATSTQIAQAFTGKITKQGSDYLLQDKDKNASYKLDDASKATRYDGKDVKVMGTLDASTNMIHVQSIEEDKNKS